MTVLDRVTVTIERMGQQGDGVGRLPSGQLVFVRGGLPGETVAAEVIERRARFVRARILTRLAESTDRETPPCPVYEDCGGCAFQHWRYEAELAYKWERVRDALTRIAGLPALAVEVEAIRGAASPYAYRTKGSFPWGGQPGRAVVGLFQRGSHRLVPLDTCAIQDPGVNRVLMPAQRAANALRLEPYDERTGTGLLRHLVVRRSRSAGETVVLVVTTRPDDRLEPWAKQLMARVPEVVGVAVNYQPDRGNRILGRRTVPLAGDPRLTETLLGVRFRLSADAFFQVNPAQVEVLYGVVLEEVRQPQEAWDLYAGVGTLAILMARPGRRVRGVEWSSSAVESAVANAQATGRIVEFAEGTVETVVPRWIAAGAKPDVVVVDPPRSGLSAEARRAIESAEPGRLIYVSCNPESWARDVDALASHYAMERVVPVDLFPRTDHVEVVSTLRRREGGA